MRPVRRLGLAAQVPAKVLALALVAAGGLAPAHAQYDDDGYDRPPPRRIYREPDYGRPPPRPMGLNCDAVQTGISGNQPYSCPLPGPRPLGSRCFCDMPISFLNGPQTAVGRVSP